MKIKQINLFDIFCLVKSEAVFLSKSWIKLIAQPLVFASLYFTLIKIITKSSEGFDTEYYEYISSGIIFMNMSNFAIVSTSSAIFSRKFSHDFDALLISPMNQCKIISAFLIGGMLRAAIIGVIIYGAASYYLDVSLGDFFITLFVAAMSIVMFSFIGVCLGLAITRFETMANISTFFLAPLMMISGVFAPIDGYPVIFKWLVSLNPFYWLLGYFRAGFMGELYPHADIVLAGVVIACAFLYKLSCFFLAQKERQHI